MKRLLRLQVMISLIILPCLLSAQTTSRVIPATGQPETTTGNGNSASANGNRWTLQQCIAYGVEHNLQVNAAALNERLSKLTWEQNRSNRLPNLNADAALGESYGRSIDPTSNQFVTTGFTYNNMSVSSQTLLFGWFQRKHMVEQSMFDLQAVQASNQQLQDDISLNIATGFLRILLAREQVKVSEGQLKLDNEQYEQTRKFAEAGQLPELNVAQMLSQVSTDSANLVGAVSEERMAILSMMALMNLDFKEAFDIATPDLNLAELSAVDALPAPEEIFSIAVRRQHKMRYNELRLLSAEKSLAIAKTTRYPQLSLMGSLATNFSSTIKDITGMTYIGESPLGNVNVGGTLYPITRPDYSYTTRTRSLWNQYGNNLRANLGIGISVPIFNGFSAMNNISKARIGVLSQQITNATDQLKLRQDIYKAYEDVKASSKKYLAARRARDAAERAQDFAVKRYKVGMINTYEYTATQNSFLSASSAALSAKYDLIFKMKVLDYYMGNPIKL